MADAVVIQIADAVVGVINSATLSQTVTAERSYVPVRDIRDLIDLAVSVVPKSIEHSLLDRGARNLRNYMVDIGVQKTIGSGAMTPQQINEACDPLMLLCEEIGDLFDGQPMAIPYMPAVPRCIDVMNDVIFVPQHIDEKRVFTGVITLHFRLAF